MASNSIVGNSCAGVDVVEEVQNDYLANIGQKRKSLKQEKGKTVCSVQQLQITVLIKEKIIQQQKLKNIRLKNRKLLLEIANVEREKENWV